MFGSGWMGDVNRIRRLDRKKMWASLSMRISVMQVDHGSYGREMITTESPHSDELASEVTRDDMGD
ncbi:unnamed protein product [Dovyalis caffra]|uniref:Uncharacterized protein n=1 Tax=Dovyalis caffra TaxID=77055 RepID=A0AAV1QXR1_9ROSI|nr:unnamed protein product [Dovyalis caffra]